MRRRKEERYGMGTVWSAVECRWVGTIVVEEKGSLDVDVDVEMKEARRSEREVRGKCEGSTHRKDAEDR